jgi:hypothetical protein
VPGFDLSCGVVDRADCTKCRDGAIRNHVLRCDGVAEERIRRSLVRRRLAVTPENNGAAGLGG